MGFFKNTAIRIAAKSTAKSLGKYISTPETPPLDAILSWACTRPSKDSHLILIDNLLSSRAMVSKLDLSLSLFYAEMEIEELDLKENFRNEIKSIFQAEMRGFKILNKN
jgi:hypothetical protein